MKKHSRLESPCIVASCGRLTGVTLSADAGGGVDEAKVSAAFLGGLLRVFVDHVTVSGYSEPR